MNQSEMNTKSRKKFSFCFRKMTVSLLIPVLLLSAACSTNAADAAAKPQKEEQIQETAFLRIDGLEIPEDVFRILLREQKAFAVNRFAEDGQAVEEEFWTTSMEDTTPLEWCKEKALQDAASLAELVLMAKENGILESDDLTLLMESREDENESRQTKKEQGEPVYGNTSFTPQTWISYVRNALRQELQRVYEAKSYDDASLQEIYDEDPSLFSKGTSVELTLIFPQAESQTIVLSQEEIGKEETAKQELFERVLESSPGDVLEEVSWDGQTIMAVVGKTSEGERDDFDSVKEQLIPMAASRQLEKDLQTRTEQAKTEKNEAAFQELKMS